MVVAGCTLSRFAPPPPLGEGPVAWQSQFHGALVCRAPVNRAASTYRSISMNPLTASHGPVIPVIVIDRVEDAAFS